MRHIAKPSANLTFSIVIPTYNYGRFVTRAIDSALQQVGNNFEVIVVDDGSTDETTEVLAEYDERIVAHRQQNAGVSVARNTGAELANGDYLLFLDADDELLPDALSHFRMAIEASPDTRFLIAHHISVTADGHEQEAKPQSVLAEPESRFRSFLNREFGIVHGSVLMRRDNFDIVRYPPGITNGEDLVIFAQCLALFPSASIPHATAKIHGHDDRARDNVEAIKKVGTQTVDLLFDPTILPAEFMKYRRDFLARRLLSLGRSLLKAGDKKGARSAYSAALQAKPTVMLNFTHLGRFARSLFG